MRSMIPFNSAITGIAKRFAKRTSVVPSGPKVQPCLAADPGTQVRPPPVNFSPPSVLHHCGLGLASVDRVPNLTKPDIAAAIAKRPVSAELT